MIEKVTNKTGTKSKNKDRVNALLLGIQGHTAALNAQEKVLPESTADLSQKEESKLQIDPNSLEIDGYTDNRPKDKLVYLDPSECYAIDQVRDGFDEEKIQERRLSIDAHSQIKPITVKPKDDRGYQIITGEYTFRACSLEPQRKIEAIIKYTDKDIDPFKKTLKQIAENYEAVPLTIYEMAISLRKAQEEGQITSMAELARHMGWHNEDKPKEGSNKVGQYLGLFSLDERGCSLYRDEKIKDIRSISILKSIMDLSPTSYGALLGMIEKGEQVTRKQLEAERDLLLGKGKVDSEGSRGKRKPNQRENPENIRVETKQTTTSSNKQSLQSTPREGEVHNVRIYFRYAGKKVELIYKEAPAGKLYCRMVDDASQQELLLESEDVSYSHYKD